MALEQLSYFCENQFLCLLFEEGEYLILHKIFPKHLVSVDLIKLHYELMQIAYF